MFCYQPWHALHYLGNRPKIIEPTFCIFSYSMDDSLPSMTEQINRNNIGIKKSSLSVKAFISDPFFQITASWAKSRLAGMLACQGRRDLRSNDLFDRANQRVVGLIGRVRTRNSPYGRAQRGRTINIPNGFFPIYGTYPISIQKK